MSQRRTRNTGSIRQIASGRFEARWRDESGRQRSKSFVVKKDATTYLQQEILRVERVRAGLERSKEEHHLFSELCDRWLQDRAAGKKESGTDESILRAHLKPAFSSLQLSAITSTAIEQYKRRKEKSKVLNYRRTKGGGTHQPGGRFISHNTINHQLMLLGAMLRHAVELGWLAVVPKIRHYKLRAQDFAYLRSEDEIKRFLTAAREDENELAYPLYATLIYTGMRVGEAAGLLLPCVSFQRGLLTIERSYDGPPKNGETRYVPILAPLKPILAAQQLKMRGSLIFTNGSGQMLNADSRVFRTVLKRVLKRALLGEHYISIHDLRHTFASWWMMTKGDVFKLQKILGHKDVKTTLRYAHLHPDRFSEDVTRFPDWTASGDDADIIPMKR